MYALPGVDAADSVISISAYKGDVARYRDGRIQNYRCPRHSREKSVIAETKYCHCA